MISSKEIESLGFENSINYTYIYKLIDECDKLCEIHWDGNDMYSIYYNLNRYTGNIYSIEQLKIILGYLGVCIEFSRSHYLCINDLKSIGFDVEEDELDTYQESIPIWSYKATLKAPLKNYRDHYIYIYFDANATETVIDDLVIYEEFKTRKSDKCRKFEGTIETKDDLLRLFKQINIKLND